MEEKVLETIVVGLTKALISESKQLFDEIYETSNDKIKQFIGNDIKNYLTKQKEKYSHIKTLLRGNTKGRGDNRSPSSRCIQDSVLVRSLELLL